MKGNHKIEYFFCLFVCLLLIANLCYRLLRIITDYKLQKCNSRYVNEL